MPNVIELDGGDFLIVGKVTPYLVLRDVVKNVESCSVGADETSVIVPRRCIVDAAREILRGEDIN